VPRKDIDQLGESQRVDRILKIFSSASLLRATPDFARGEDLVETSLEALVQNWPRLKTWLEEERSRRLKRLRFASAACQWADQGRERANLIGGGLLAEALRFSDLNELEREFVQASRDFEVSQLRRERGVLVILVVLLAIVVVVIGLAYRVTQGEQNRAKKLLELKQTMAAVPTPPPPSHADLPLLTRSKIAPGGIYYFFAVDPTPIESGDLITQVTYRVDFDGSPEPLVLFTTRREGAGRPFEVFYEGSSPNRITVLLEFEDPGTTPIMANCTLPQEWPVPE